MAGKDSERAWCSMNERQGSSGPDHLGVGCGCTPGKNQVTRAKSSATPCAQKPSSLCLNGISV